VSELGPTTDLTAPESDFRGKDASYLAPPAQIRTGPIRAYGLYDGRRAHGDEAIGAQHLSVVEPSMGEAEFLSFLGDQVAPLRSQPPLRLTITVDLVLAHGQVAPACNPLQVDRNDGQFCNLHSRQLTVPRA
jgi:hypothetical protein